MRSAQVTVYLAQDGREFRDVDRCLAYEAACAAVTTVTAPLGERRNDNAYANGGGYVQHRAGVTGETTWRAIRSLPGVPHPRDAEEPWNGAYYRAQCIDAHGREWGQPYYANHPESATMRCLEVRS